MDSPKRLSEALERSRCCVGRCFIGHSVCVLLCVMIGYECAALYALEVISHLS